jgi:hypothetical protein
MSTLTHLTSKTGLIQLSIIAFFVIFAKFVKKTTSVAFSIVFLNHDLLIPLYYQYQFLQSFYLLCFQRPTFEFLLDGGSPVMLAFPRVLMGGRFRKDVLLS